MTSTHQAATEKPSKILVVDNGSFSIKAGFSSEHSPRITLQNCAAVPLAKKFQDSSSGSAPNVIVGDDIYLLHNYFCIRPFEGSLLVDGNLQRLIWDYLFSDEALKLNKFRASNILITEPYGAPTSVRHVLSQILFEEYGLERLLISPSQQLVAITYSAGTCFDISHYGELKIRPWEESVMKPSAKLDYFGITDDPNFFKDYPTLIGDTCQLIIDMGHQSTWSVPMLGNMPIDIGVMRANIGGMHASNLLKNLLAYQTIDLTHNEFIINLAKKARKLYENGVPATIPTYKFKGEDYNEFELMDFENSGIIFEKGDHTWKDKLNSKNISNFSIKNERIRCGELIFSPADYQFEVERSKPSQLQKSTQPASMECSLPELIENSIFACPPIVQSSLAKRILLAGGSAASPYFAYRLLMELKKRLPENWPICIYQTMDFVNTAWRGGSIWASNDDQYYTYSISRSDYLESY